MGKCRLASGGKPAPPAPRRQARSETPHPTADDAAAVIRQNARGTRREWPYADRGASAFPPPRQKRRNHLLQPLRACRLITLWNCAQRPPNMRLMSPTRYRFDFAPAYGDFPAPPDREGKCDPQRETARAAKDRQSPRGAVFVAECRSSEKRQKSYSPVGVSSSTPRPSHRQ